MTVPSEQLTERPTLAQWSATAFVVLIPIHVVFLDLGFSLKPWFVPLLIGLAVSWAAVFRAAWTLPRAMQIGMGLMLSGGVLGLAVSADQARALRHLLALGIVLAVMVFLIATKRIPYLGVAFRAGALLMAVTVIVEALLLMPRWVSVASLQETGRFVGQLAEVAYGDIILVTGTHGDSNFSALYAATWLFLVLAYPAERFFARRWDGVIVGLLVLQLFLSLSKTGLLSVTVAIAATSVMYRVVRQWRSVRPAVLAGVIAFVSVAGVLLVADATDGHHDIAHGLRKRGGQVLTEASSAGALVTGEPVPPLDRAGIWKGYIQDFTDHPLTGTGLGTPTVRPQYAHSAPLEAAGGSGILGLAGWATVWAVVGLRLRRLVLDRPEALPLVGACGVVFMASLFLSTNYEPIVALVFALVLRPHLPVKPEAP